MIERHLVATTTSGGGSASQGRLLPVVAIACAVCCVVTGCVSQDVADTANERLNYGMSTSELIIARSAALDQARKEEAKVTARATVSEAATASAFPTAKPKPCTSGRLLHITMAGQFPHKPPATSDSTPVSGQELTVDAATGRVCDAHYLTGLIALDPESVLLFTNY